MEVVAQHHTEKLHSENQTGASGTKYLRPVGLEEEPTWNGDCYCYVVGWCHAIDFESLLVDQDALELGVLHLCC